MEILLLLVLFFTLDKNGSAQETLRSFLGFYKENRELISMLAKGVSAKAETAPSAAPAEREPADEETKNRPENGGGNLNVLEEYLKRCSV